MSFSANRRHVPNSSRLDNTDGASITGKNRDVNGRGRLTVTWSELPDWMRDNEYILSGYRRCGELQSWRACAVSVFGYLHNETVNIHSHLEAAVLFGFFLLTFDSSYFSAYESVSWIDYAVFVIFLSSAIFCLTSSAFFHMSTAHSKSVAARCHALDYSRIVVLTVGSFFPCIYYGFYCDRLNQSVYLSMITCAGLGAAYIVLNPEYAKPTHRGARTKVFIGLGLCSVLPVSHALISHGFYTLCQEMGFQWLLLSGTLYIVGALLYANRIPERLAPGKFDIFFASHQIFHFCVVLAALAHYVCILTAFDHWHSRRGVCS
ncbi:HlyIII-domain-containing protein [Artomyces pyxidatus]|uniref:HlyIII-domain-containing protein n=1 Tax=Artomyces pyxidatus TaxID=48021 RepID=A0ACB8TEH5_9AGAM|nr:HlyIII-domain-containing protein [Artomyces pyxidatus]